MSTFCNENDMEYRMARYLIRDEDTDEIIGLSEDAPEDIKAFYAEYMADDSVEPIVM